jgi:4-diphosphocytidyl-2-C-methyl-D-erythritol kinase
MRSARVMAQAKVNIFLLVGGVDDSGYHVLATLFQRIDLADEVVVHVGGRSRSLSCSGPRLPKDGLGPVEKNLAFRAALAYADRTGWPHGFAIDLTKNIPVGGGLGGGSADAGAVLRALDTLSDKPGGVDELQDIARSLGADVPFLASEYVSAIGLGRGDRIQPHPSRRPLEVLVIVPSFSVSTTDAYRWLDEHRGAYSAMPNEEGGLLVRGEREGGNDFEAVVEQRYPHLRQYRERLLALGAQTARLAGSGACVFGIFEGSAPDTRGMAADALVLRTRTSARVVQVEVLK